jgi:hypothetical protein
MTVPFRRLLVHWRSLVIVLVPLVLSPLIALGSKVGILNVTWTLLSVSVVKTSKDVVNVTNECSSLLIVFNELRNICIV